jgi:hypothetical protein
MKQKYEAKDLQALVDVGRAQGYLTFKTGRRLPAPEHNFTDRSAFSA